MKVKANVVLTILLLVTMLLVAGCNRGADMRTDQQIAADVQSKIMADANLPNKLITVNANNGTVTLTGSVGSETERLTAANDASSVEGVKQVVNNLTVSPDMVGSTAMPSNATAPANTTPRNTAPVNRATTTTTRTGTAAATAPASSTVTIPAGTNMEIRLIDTIDSETAETGQTFSATLDNPIYVNNKIAVPANADVTVKAIDIKSAGKFKGRSEMILEVTRIAYNGKAYNVNSDRWQKYGASRGKNTAAKVGGGAALGAIIGGIAGGGKGAAIGAGVGAGAGTGVQAVTKGEQIELKPETLLNFTLEAPVTVTPSASNRNPNRTRLGTNN